MTAKVKASAGVVKERSEVSFKCQSCGKMKKLTDMRVVTRFFPVMVVCADCERKIV